MLWAQFQPKNDAEAAGFFVGIMIAGLVSGGIPFFTGLAMKQTTLGIVGGVVSAGAGALAGCCGGIPVAVIFTMVIVLVAQTSGVGKHAPRLNHDDAFDYDEYGNAFKLARRERHARPEEPAGERRREADEDWRRRSEQEEQYHKRGFRPRSRDRDADDHSGPRS